MAVRYGNTPVPDSSWTAYQSVASSGGSLSGSSRYAQYAATLTSSGFTTPQLESVTLSAASGAAPPVLSVADASVVEGQSGSSTLLFTVSLSPTSNGPVTVSYATSGVSATAGSDYTTASGVLTFAAGDSTKTIAVAVNGDTTFEGNETLLLDLSAATGAVIGRGQATGTVVNDDGQPTLSIASASRAEGNTGTAPLALVVSLSNPSAQTITVAYATGGGTATPSTDYTSQAATLTFNPGVLQQTINVPIVGDSVLEPDETFLVTLSAATNATLAQAQATATIVNDDAASVLAIANASVTEGNTITNTLAFTVTLTPANPSQTVTVAYATANGTATAGADYTSAAGTLTFAPGTTSRTISIAVPGDTLDEDNETMTVTLSSPVNATIGTATATGTINDNDNPPSMSIADASVNEGSGVATVTVSLSAASGRAISVNFATANGSASAGQDYTSTSGSLSFPAGTTSRTISVPVLNDALDEPSESFNVNLSAAVNASIADGVAAVSIADNDPQPTLAISDFTASEGANGTTKTFTFTVTLSAASGQTVTVNYATANNTATAGTTGDYIATSGSLTFTAGVVSRTISVTVRGDGTRESNETFFVNLSAASNASISDGQGLGTITNDD
jgi:chitinase